MYKVVLVDDENVIIQGLMRVIPWDQYDCQVVGTASDGIEGIELVRKENPDILFSDIRMPNLDGLGMIAALKSEFPRLQITVLTAYRDFDYAQQAMHLGACRYLLKPSKMDELKEAITHMTSILKKLPPLPDTGVQADDVAATKEEEAAGSFVLNAAMAYIEQNFSGRITLGDVAEHVFVSPWHLSRLINKYQEKSFFDIVNQLRIQKAKELLKNPALKVHEVAEQVGFADVAHFSKNFKRSVGKSPLEYRTSL